MSPVLHDHVIDETSCDSIRALSHLFGENYDLANYCVVKLSVFIVLGIAFRLSVFVERRFTSVYDESYNCVRGV